MRFFSWATMVVLCIACSIPGSAFECRRGDSYICGLGPSQETYKMESTPTVFMCVHDATPSPVEGEDLFQEGLEQLSDRNVTAALNLFARATEKGHWKAQLAIIDFHIRTYHHGPWSYDLLYQQLRGLAARGIPEAVAMQARWERQFKGTREGALFLDRKAAAMGSRTAQESMGLELFMDKPADEAESYFRCAYSQGSGRAAYWLVSMLRERGEGKKADTIALGGAKLGDIECFYRLINSLEERSRDYATAHRAQCLRNIGIGTHWGELPISDTLYPPFQTFPHLDSYCREGELLQESLRWK